MALLTEGGGSADAALVLKEEERLDDEEGRRRREMPPPLQKSETRESDADFAGAAFRAPMQARCPDGTREPIMEPKDNELL